MNYTKLTNCRLCDSKRLEKVLDLGEQAMTGIFPTDKIVEINKGPIELTLCMDCGMLQLAHTYSLTEMYGDNYGYRSGLNISMIEHLSDTVHMLQKKYNLQKGDTVLDIGSNDGTTLKAYSVPQLNLIGMDPTGKKFKKYYTDNIKLVEDFFSSEKFFTAIKKKAKIVTTIAMFYDLEKPVEFAKDVAQVMEKDGVWHLEQSYLPLMLKTCSYDMVGQEHLEYYSLKVIKRIMDDADLRLIDVSINDTNGGSIAVTVAKKESKYKSNDVAIDWLLLNENELGLDTKTPYEAFTKRIQAHKKSLLKLLDMIKKDNKTVLGYGASTKGNVVLQYCGLTCNHLPAIAEVNTDKFGCFTPGTKIPIISEEEARKINPDYFLVLPWHFRDMILKKETDYIKNGGKFIFPLPDIEIV